MEREQDDAGYIPVDPPVGPYSTPEEIRRWIAELEEMPQVPDVPDALEEARAWLADAAEPD